MLTKTRKWTAEVMVAGQDVTGLLQYGNSDTLKAVTDDAVKLAAQLIREEYGSDASVRLFKQLKTLREPRFDRSVYVYRDWDRNGDAVIRVQR
jgi:hypothetical protein